MIKTQAATPLMQQYLQIKERYQEEILFFRLGDFYEMFFEDAIKAAPILEVALTQRQTVPMCGIPHHAMTSYVAKLIKAGISVAVAEQLEDPKKTKGMVKRDVVRVITPGTLVEDELLPSKANNFIVSIAVLPSAKNRPSHWAMVAADVSTGRQWVGEVEGDDGLNMLKAHLASLAPSEILLVGEASSTVQSIASGRAVVRLSPLSAEPAGDLKKQADNALQSYLVRDHSEAIKSLQPALPLPMQSSGVMFLDETAIRHLELVASSDPLRSGPTLLSVIDEAVTPLGSRLLRWWLLHPSISLPVIQNRLEQVESFVEDSLIREEFRTGLNGLADIERISVRAQAGTSSPRDLEALREALRRMPALRESLRVFQERTACRSFDEIVSGLAVPSDLVSMLESQLADHPSAKVVDGGVIRDGANADLDELRGFRRNSKKWIADMEAQERERTGIGSLKVGFNDIFGYFLEVSRSNLPKVPPEWIRKQTMANGERYITPALKEQEEKILGAEEKILALETRLFTDLIHQVAVYGPTLARVSDAIAQIDAIASLSQIAVQNDFVRPDVNDSNDVRIKGGRHPVIEKQIGRDRFIPNDLVLTSPTQRISVITGPNMAGKSTYLRQTALIVILAQMGSFVPAEKASIGIVDKIFTRIGASDRLAQGQSTFMVEMQEVATLISNATPQSLLILDEVGRGTSTYDGVSIAWAVIEYLSKSAPRTLFATHYFELTELEGKLAGVFNAHATAKEWPGPDGRRQVVFLYQILPGAADRSYGIHVAEMAGLPVECIDRSREILHQLETGNHSLSSGSSAASNGSQLEFGLFSEHPVVSDLRDLKIDQMTPLEAMNTLAALKKKAGQT